MKIIEFLQNAKVFQIAIVDGDQPHTRPIGFVMEYDGGLAFYSDKRKGPLTGSPIIEPIQALIFYIFIQRFASGILHKHIGQLL